LRISGTRPSVIYAYLMASNGKTFTGFLKNVNGASMEAITKCY
jgi:hypothetical protein